MNSLQVSERAGWHNRNALAFPPNWPANEPKFRHHARCFVLLMTWLRRGQDNDFEEAKRIMRP